MDWLRRLDAQTKEYVLNPTLLYQKLARREEAGHALDDAGHRAPQGQDRAADRLRDPESGTPLVVDAIAVVAGARNPGSRGSSSNSWAAPRAWCWPREHFRLPARADIPADSLPEGCAGPANSSSRAARLGAAQEKTSEWMRFWDENIRGRGRN